MIAGVAVLVTLGLLLKDRMYVDAALYLPVALIGAYLSTRSEEFYAWASSQPLSARFWDAAVTLVGVVLAVRFGGVFRVLPILGLLVMSVRLHLGFRDAQRQLENTP